MSKKQINNYEKIGLLVNLAICVVVLYIFCKLIKIVLI